MMHHFAGNPCAPVGSGDGGPATEAHLGNFFDLALGPDGLYIADTHNYRIRKVDKDGIIDTIAGNGTFGSPGSGGPALSLPLEPYRLVVASDKTVYFVQAQEHRVWRLETNGLITPFAGTGVADFSGEGGPALLAELYDPTDLALGPDGSLYIADYQNHRIRRVSTQGIIETVAGSGNTSPFNGDGIDAKTANLWGAIAIAVGPSGTLFTSDQPRGRVRAVGSNGIIYTVAGDGTHDLSHDDVYATATGVYGCGLAVESSGNLLIAECLGNYERYRRVKRLVDTYDGQTTVNIPSADGPRSRSTFTRPDERTPQRLPAQT